MPTLVGGDAEFELLVVRQGEFVMGSENQLFSESPPHAVRIGADFLLGKYSATQLQWQAVMGSNPSEFTDSPNHPVGLRQPNSWGFCDMIGNVWDWTADVWHSLWISTPPSKHSGIPPG